MAPNQTAPARTCAAATIPRTSCIDEVLSARQLLLDKAAPDFIGLPNRMQISFGFRMGSALMQDAVKKHERRNAFVRGTMNKYMTVVERVHHSTKSAKIL